MRREGDFFGEEELVLLYVARRLKEALALEHALDAGSVDYAVEAGPYTSGILFFSRRIGAFFYVTPANYERALRVIVEAGFKPHK